MKIYIYVIYFPTSNKYYIGQTYNIKQRMFEHLRSGKIICNALNKYDDWQVSILHTCESRDAANLIEIEEIRNFNCVVPNGYNLTRGGEGATHCEETKEKIRAARQGTFASKKTKEKMSEIRQGKNNPFYGKHHTEETKEKNRKAHLGRQHTEEAKKKMSHKGKDNSMFGRKRLDIIKRNKENNPMKNSTVVLKAQRTKLINRLNKLQEESHG